MIYLVLSIIMSCTMTAILKTAVKWNVDEDNVILVNYIVATGFSLFWVLQKDLHSDFLTLFCTADISTVFTQKCLENTYFLLTVVGIVSGAIFILDLINIKTSIIHNGAGMTSLFSKFSFLFTMLMAAIIWHELPNRYQFVGVVLAVLALFAASGNLKNVGHIEMPGILFTLILFEGVAALLEKVVVSYSISKIYNDLYLLITFFSALCLAVLYIYILHKWKKERFFITIKDILAGIGEGMSNVLTSYFALRALEVMPSNIFYPTSAAGNLIAISILSATVFHEKLSRGQISAIMIMIVSLVLVNI